MLFEDTYKTIQRNSEGIFRDKGSKFIAYAYPFTDENTLKDIITEVKKEHPKARHHCYAWRLTTDRSVFRINDDGEPSGTAGRPILNTLLSHDVTNILVVVVRYFGGTLLGVPGLINAYKTATEEALTHAEIIEKTVNDIYRLSFDYLQMNDVMKVIKEEELIPENQLFDLQCSLDISVRKSELDKVIGKIEKIDGVKAKYLKTI
ncbi:IMPACT family protein [Pseudopedobacter beijingensis]|uniref:IMPACT family protein n=1 Tax=Pseudopedobacter beijingensis TaxID=1207056 RepID=A0ABW4IJV7_9SPHI